MCLNQNKPSNVFRITVMQSVDENLQCSLTREAVIPGCIHFYLTQSTIIVGNNNNTGLSHKPI